MNIQCKSILLLGDYTQINGKASTSRRIIDMLKDYFERTNIGEKGYDVSRVQIAKTIDEANVFLKREYFDVLISLDSVGDMPIGVGKIKKWREISPKTRTILLMKTDGFGGKKVQALFDINCYDACFFSGLTMPELNRIILYGRTAAMAEKYYGLQAKLSVGTEEVQKSTPAGTGERNFKEQETDTKSSLWKQAGEENIATGKKRKTENVEPAEAKGRGEKSSDSSPDTGGKTCSGRGQLTFREGRVISVLSDKTVIIETADSNGLQKGDTVAVPRFSSTGQN